jgi:hypothetical protein
VDKYIELAIFFIGQTGVAVWTVSSMRTEIRNLKDWVKSISNTSKKTTIRLSYIEGVLGITPPD